MVNGLTIVVDQLVEFKQEMVMDNNRQFLEPNPTLPLLREDHVVLVTKVNQDQQEKGEIQERMARMVNQEKMVNQAKMAKSSQLLHLMKNHASFAHLDHQDQLVPWDKRDLEVQKEPQETKEEMEREDHKVCLDKTDHRDDQDVKDQKDLKEQMVKLSSFKDHQDQKDHKDLKEKKDLKDQQERTEKLNPAHKDHPETLETQEMKANQERGDLKENPDQSERKVHANIAQHLVCLLVIRSISNCCLPVHI